MDTEQSVVRQSNADVLIVTACPGSGKTRTMLEKVKKCIDDGIPPKEILVISYSNKAVNEIKNRMPIESISVGTFHSICSQLLRENDDKFTIIEPESRYYILCQLLHLVRTKLYLCYIEVQVVSPSQFCAMWRYFPCKIDEL